MDADEVAIADIDTFLANGEQHRLRHVNEVKAEGAPAAKHSLAWVWNSAESV